MLIRATIDGVGPMWFTESSLEVAMEAALEFNGRVVVIVDSVDL